MPIKYDLESNSFIETEGWRSRGCIVTLVSYILALIAIVWHSVLYAIWYGPYILVALVLFALAALLGYI